MCLEHRHHRLVKPLAAVNDDQQSGFVLHTAFDQIGQEATADALVFRGRLHEAQRDLLSVEGDAQSDDDLLVRETLAVQKQRHQVISFQGSLLEFSQLSSRAFHVTTGHR